MEARFTEEEAFERIMAIINEPKDRHYIARAVEKARRKKGFDGRGCTGGRGSRFGIFYTPIVQMAGGEYDFDHIVFETNTNDTVKLEKLRKWILNAQRSTGVSVSTVRDGKNMLCYLRGKECEFKNPLRISYFFREDYRL